MKSRFLSILVIGLALIAVGVRCQTSETSTTTDSSTNAETSTTVTTSTTIETTLTTTTTPPTTPETTPTTTTPATTSTTTPTTTMPTTTMPTTSTETTTPTTSTETTTTTIEITTAAPPPPPSSSSPTTAAPTTIPPNTITLTAAQGQKISLSVFLAQTSPLLQMNSSQIAHKLCTINGTRCSSSASDFTSTRSRTDPYFLYIQCGGANAAHNCNVLFHLNTTQLESLGILGLNVYTYSPTPPPPPSEKNELIAVGVGSGVVVLLIVLGFALWYDSKRAVSDDAYQEIDTEHAVITSDSLTPKI